jgi:glycosyltransferase involved in cell wall biosynthesis
MGNLSKNVLVIANTYVHADPRVMPESIAIAEAGYSVFVVGAARYGGQPTQESLHNMTIISVPMVTSWHPIIMLKETWRLIRGDIGTINPGEGMQNNTNLATLFFCLWAIRLTWKMPAIIVHAHDTPQLPVSWLLAKLKRAKLIYDAHEDARGYFGRIGGLIETVFLRRVDTVITVGERLASALRHRGASEVVIVGSWKNLDKYNIDPQLVEDHRKKLNLEGKLTVCLYGSLGPVRYVSSLIEAAEQSPDVLLLLSGKGPDVETAIAASRRSPNIRWFGWLDPEELPLYTKAADAIFCCFNPDILEQAYYATPNKLFEAFAAGKALIATAGLGEISAVLERIPAGIMLNPVNSETIKGAFEQLKDPNTLSSLQKHSFEARNEYNWDKAKERLLAIYTKLSQKS